jgi:hypothetical protein
MGSEPILAVDEDIDDHIRTFCTKHPKITPPEVIRDIARIVCIVNLVREGTLNDTDTVLCGGMAMRCLNSPRMSVYDGDTASTLPTNTEAMATAISHDEDAIEIVAGPWEQGRDLITFSPVTFDARFSELTGAQNTFSLSIAHRGIEDPPIRCPLNHRYPFRLLADEVEVPIMAPDEILAEKIVAWWLFGHAKHYNDIAFLAGRKATDPARPDKDSAARLHLRNLVERKLAVNRKISAKLAALVDALDQTERRRRLAAPDAHVAPSRSFNSLSYLHDTPPTLETLKRFVTVSLMAMLFGDRT